MSDIKIIDNFLPILQQKELLSILNDESFTWNYIYEADVENTWKYQEQDKSIAKYDQFVKLFTEDEFGYWHDVIKFNILKHFQIKVRKIKRMRLVFGIPRPTLRDFSYGTPHVDLNVPHQTLIYYANTNNAKTVFFEEFYKDQIDYSKKNIYQTVEPKQGRAVLFDGLRYHTVQPHSDTNRLLLNVNFFT